MDQSSNYPPPQGPVLLAVPPPQVGPPPPYGSAGGFVAPGSSDSMPNAFKQQASQSSYYIGATPTAPYPPQPNHGYPPHHYRPPPQSHTPSPYYPTQPLISNNHHQGSQTQGVDPRDGRVYLVPSDFQGPHDALRQAWPNTLVLFISLVLFTASISLMFIEGHFYFYVKAHQSDIWWDWCIIPSIASFLYFLTSFLGFSTNNHPTPSGIMSVIGSSIVAAFFSIILVWSGWWGDTWGHGMEYPVIGTFSGILSMVLGIVSAQAKFCSPHTTNRG